MLQSADQLVWWLSAARDNENHCVCYCCTAHSDHVTDVTPDLEVGEFELLGAMLDHIIVILPVR
jgi:hypothetical protein